MKQLAAHYEAEKAKLTERCTLCGNCVRRCRVMPFTGITETPRGVQEGILDFLRGGEGSDAARTRVSACMRCFGCLDVTCPIGTNPMMIAELFDRETQLRRDKPFDMPDYPVHDGLARAGTSPEEYVRITTERIKTGAKTLFFPGCNVYKQPDKLLCALFLLDACGEEYSFLPGMKHCCGWTPGGCAGDAESLQERAEQLMARIEGSGASQAVFWCPTCLCIIKEKMRHFLTPSVNCVTFGEYIAAHVGRLSFPAAGPHKIALHDPCKSAYLGIDIDPGSVRTLLRAIPGTELVEMPRHGRNTVCCGCDAVPGVPEVGARVTEERLREAAATGADTLIDICHNCHWIFKPAQKRMESAPEASALRIVNYATYIAAAMGMERPDSL